jgi:hypothetical protein
MAVGCYGAIGAATLKASVRMTCGTDCVRSRSAALTGRLRALQHGHGLLDYISAAMCREGPLEAGEKWK